ncbi:MAG: DUF177 domain-containing protein [Acidobacteriia bacterium]|nr:DUF177 domain-containing protein [Terriglobia bacterium]
MFIEIERLTLEPLHVQHVYGIGELQFKHADAALEEPVATDFILTHKEKDLRVVGTIQTAIRYQCSRCLKEFSAPLDGSFDLFYLPQADWKKDEEVELKYEDMEVGYYDGLGLDVDLMVLEQIELAMPMKFICREGCKGLCPSCGADLNEGQCLCKVDTTDSRLAVLRDFHSKMKE